ncbi:MAG: type III-B CRISPR module-associated protein Cmr5 [Rhodocyclaceae bacterium]|nr:type III-B CRISPR module-associated protein Cmr5 [Rhodocyclaceae bacterium]
MPQTLDQQRAAFAWQCAKNNQRLGSDYKNLCKGAPALIMGNGLMPALAFWKSRGKPHADALVADLLGWFHQRWNMPQNFAQVMTRLQAAPTSATYMQATDEALEFLKWLRQFADAVSGAGQGERE